MLFAVWRSPFAVEARTSPRTLRPLRCANPLDKPRQHLFDVRHRTLQHLSLPWSEKSQVLRQQNKTNQFIGRTGGYVQELPEFGAGCSSASLRDIGGDGSRCSSHLANQAKFLGMRIRGRGAIDAQSQSLTPVPYFEFPKVLHVATPFGVVLESARLAQQYYRTQVLSGRAVLAANDKLQTANASGELPC